MILSAHGMPGSIDCALVHSSIRADDDRRDDEDGDMTGMMITTAAIRNDKKRIRIGT